MSRKTQGVEDLVNRALQKLTPPYGEDIIEDVCLHIEHDTELRAEYEHLKTDLSKDVVNNWIGQYTRQITGGDTIREVAAKRSHIIGAYTKLKF